MCYTIQIGEKGLKMTPEDIGTVMDGDETWVSIDFERLKMAMQDKVFYPVGVLSSFEEFIQKVEEVASSTRASEQ